MIKRLRSQSGLSLQFLRGSSLLGYTWAAKLSVWALETVTSLDPESKMKKAEMYFFKTLLSVAPFQRIGGQSGALNHFLLMPWQIRGVLAGICCVTPGQG